MQNEIFISHFNFAFEENSNFFVALKFFCCFKYFFENLNPKRKLLKN